MGNDISLSGDKGCGKSQVAQSILNKGPFVVHSFAQPLKTFLQNILMKRNSKIQIAAALYGDKDNSYVMVKLDKEIVQCSFMELTGLTDADHYVDMFMDWIESFNGGELVNDQVTGRRLLQVVGTEFFRWKIAETFWCDLMQESVLDARDNNLSVVVDDTRFPDEFELLESLGFKMVKILQPLYGTNIERQGHISENQLKDYEFDVYFLNDKSLGKEPIEVFVSKELINA